MGDSDDDHDRSHSRDKFRRERSDYGSEKGGNKRGDSYNRERNRSWRDGSWREDRRRPRDDDDDGGRRRYSSGYSRSRDWSPPHMKRPRKSDWESLRDYSGIIPPYGMPPPPWMHHPGGPPHGHPMVPGIPREALAGASPAASRHSMLSFKQFLTQQDDGIDEKDAITSYNEYKNEFRGKQMKEFFEAHKDEEWFQTMYHPSQLEASKSTASAFLSSRVKAFLFLMDNDWFRDVSLSYGHSKGVVRIMDAAVIKMEGGTDLDLAALDKEEEEQGTPKTAKSEKKKKPKSSVSDEEVSDGDLEEELSAEKTGGDNADKNTNGINGEENSSQEEQKDPMVQELHKTCSIYLRHLPPKISSEDIVSICKTVPGYLRIAFAEPSSEKNYERRGWATFSGETDVNTVMTKLASTKVKDSLLTCTVNRELTRRIKQTTQASWCRKCLQADIGHALKLIEYMDNKTFLWEYAEEDKQANPVLTGNLPVLLEEEESVSMGVGEDEEGAIADNSLDKMAESSPKLKAFELLVWYLRIVHSCDFYSAATFASEDTMPHRCGIFTVRPSSSEEAVSQADTTTYCEEAVPKIEALAVKRKELSDADIDKFGKKDPEAEAEQFVEINTQKLSENKYLCPLSGKKFKGPEFVRKHIFNKHLDKVEAVKKEAGFFNNYLRDPDRPMPKEVSVKTPILPPTPKTPGSDEPPVLLTPGMPAPGTPVPWGGQRWGDGGFGSFRGERSRGRGRRGRGRRNMVHYRDLDAPDEDY